MCSGTMIKTEERKGALMKYQPIITVGRQYGSGGRYVAKLLAEKLDIPFPIAV